MEYMHMGITDNIETMDQFLQIYNEKLEKQAVIDINLFSKPIIAKFYRICMNGDFSIDEFVEHFHIEDKEKFLKEATNEYEFVKKQSYNNYKLNHELLLYINFQELSKPKMEKISEYVETAKIIHGNNIKVFILSPEKGFDKTCLDNLLTLSQSIDFTIRENWQGGTDVTLQQTIDAYDLMDKELDKIMKLNLSPFEQFLFIHDFASNKIYKKENSQEDFAKSRSFINAMTSGNIVCVGYANIMEEFCNRVGIECKVIHGGSPCDVTTYREDNGHAANIVYLKDEKYGIDGYYFCDACWDAKQDDDENKNYFYSALPLQDIEKIGQAQYFEKQLETGNLPKTSKPIPIKNFTRALKNLYCQTNENYIEKTIEQNVDFSIKYAFTHCKANSTNCFIQEYYSRRAERQHM